MPKIICTLPNASKHISGVVFVDTADKMAIISEEISEEQAAIFLSIPGYEPAPVDDDATEKEAIAAEKAAKKATDKAAALKDAVEKKAADKKVVKKSPDAEPVAPTVVPAVVAPPVENEADKVPTVAATLDEKATGADTF